MHFVNIGAVGRLGYLARGLGLCETRTCQGQSVTLAPWLFVNCGRLQGGNRGLYILDLRLVPEIRRPATCRHLDHQVIISEPAVYGVLRTPSDLSTSGLSTCLCFRIHKHARHCHRPVNVCNGCYTRLNIHIHVKCVPTITQLIHLGKRVTLSSSAYVDILISLINLSRSRCQT